MRITDTTKKNLWKNNITKYGRQFVDVLEIYEEDNNSIGSQPLGYLGALDENDIKKVEYTIDSGIFKSDMGTLIAEISKDSPVINLVKKNRLLHYSITALNESGNIFASPSCDYGFFVITKIEDLKDKNSLLLTCYDEMIRTMVPYDKPLMAYETTNDNTFLEGKSYYNYISGQYVEYTGSRTGNPHSQGLYEYIHPSFPMKLETYFYYLAQNLNIGWNFSELNVVNKDNYLQKEPYLDDDGNSLGYTYRDIFDDIAEACGCRIVTKTNVENNQRFHYYQMVRMFHDYTNTENYNEDYFNENGVSIGEKYGPINSIIISNTESTRNIFFPDTIPENPVSVNITNNRILEQNNVDEFKQAIYDNVKNIEYYSNDLQSKGIGLLEIGDVYKVTLKGTSYKCILFNDDFIRTTGLKENTHTEPPEQNVNDNEYISRTSKTEITSNLAYLKLNNIINGTQALDELNVNGDADITGDTTIGGKLIIQKDGDHNKGLYDENGDPIIRDWQNNDVSVDATGRNLYLGYQNTTGLNVLNGKFTIASNGDLNNKTFDLFNDTSGSDWKTMLKNKLDYCINNINTTKNYTQTFINGGWSGVMYGFGMFSKINTTYQLVWFSGWGTYYVFKNGTNYSYNQSLYTGVIQESGSNTNGRYIKYGDGTLIQWNRLSVKDQAINNAYGSLYIGNRNITFPIAFVGSTPTVTCSEFQWGTQGSWGAVVGNNTTLTGTTLRGFDVGSRATGTTCSISWYAIGRWE